MYLLQLQFFNKNLSPLITRESTKNRVRVMEFQEHSSSVMKDRTNKKMQHTLAFTEVSAVTSPRTITLKPIGLWRKVTLNANSLRATL
jgi:hypothetical protein